MPDITFALDATLDAFDSLGIKTDVEQFARRHWTLPKQPLKALDALILGVGTPAHSLSDLAVGLDWGKNRFGPLLGEVDPFSWVRLLRRPMRRKLRKVLLRYHGPGVSEATKSRYRITFVWDITTLLKVGEMLGLANLFYSGMLKRPAQSIEVVLLYAIVGEDHSVLPLSTDGFPHPKARPQRSRPPLQNRTGIGQRDVGRLESLPAHTRPGSQRSLPGS